MKDFLEKELEFGKSLLTIPELPESVYSDQKAYLNRLIKVIETLKK